MKIKAAVIHKYNDCFHIEDVDLAEPEEGQIQVKVVACGVCHTDDLARHGVFPLPTPAVLGHEGAGIVEKVGPGVTKVAVGDHVVMSFPSCGQCITCLSGRPNLCTRTLEICFMGHFVNGKTPISQNGKDISNFFGQSSFATHVIADVSGVVKVDPDVDLRLLGPLGCGFLTGSGVVLNAFHPLPGDSIAIFGAGGVGLSAVMAAKLCNCLKIICVDVIQSRLETALALGATHVINSKEVDDVSAEIFKITNGIGADFALDTTGVRSCIKAAATGIHWGGRAGGVVSIGEVNVDDWTEWFAGKRWDNFVEGDAVPQLFIPRLVALYKAGKFPIDKLIKFYPLEKIEEAFEASHNGSVVKPVIVMDDSI